MIIISIINTNYIVIDIFFYISLFKATIFMIIITFTAIIINITALFT